MKQEHIISLHNSNSRACVKIMPITIPVKSVYTIKMHGGFWHSEEHFSRIWETNKIMLYYRDSKNTEQKILLKNEDFRQYFDNHPVKEEE